MSKLFRRNRRLGYTEDGSNADPVLCNSVDLWHADRRGKQAALRLMSGLRVELGVLTMQDIKQRREEIAQQLRDPRTREEIIQRLKTLMGLRPGEPLPNGTPIITTLIKLEEEQLRTRS